MQIPDYFSFFNRTRIISGKKALENIPYELQSMDAVKPLVITDRKSVEDGLAIKLILAYGNSGMVIGAVFDDVSGYASTKIVFDAAELYRARGCDSIIAIGGDAVAAVARGVNLLVSHKTGDLVQLAELPDTMHLRPFIVIPTSYSTGRETASSCVIDATLFKSDELMPDIAIIDPRMLKKRDNGDIIPLALNALAVAIEACTEAEANPMNDAFAFAAIQLIRENLPAAVKGSLSSKAGLGLANGIAISGIVSSNAPAGLCSVLSRELEKTTGNSREICSAILLPYVLNYKLANVKNGVRGELLLPMSGIDNYCAAAESMKGQFGVAAVEDFVQSMKKHIPVTLKELSIPLYILENAAEIVEPKFIKEYGKGGVMNILRAAYEGGIPAGGKKK